MPELRVRALPAAITDSLFADENDGAALLDMQGRVLRANAQFGALSGVRQGELAWAGLPEAAMATLAAALRAA